MKKEQWGADISNSLGAPFGGLGTGYFVYGRHGFVNWNVDGFPEQEQTAAYPHTQLWDYHTDDPASGIYYTGDVRRSDRKDGDRPCDPLG